MKYEISGIKYELANKRGKARRVRNINRPECPVCKKRLRLVLVSTPWHDHLFWDCPCTKQLLEDIQACKLVADRDLEDEGRTE